MYPFRDSYTFATFRNIIDSVTNEIKSLDNEYVLKASEAELEEYFIDKAIIEPLVLHSDQQYIKNQTGTQIDVSHDFRRPVFPGERAVVRGTRIDIAIPFEGDPMLWRVRASTWSGGYPDIEVKSGEIMLSVCFPDDSANPDQLKGEIHQNIKSLEDAIGYLKNDVQKHNNSVPNRVKQTLKRKRELAQTTTGAVAALGIPVKRADASPTFTVPSKRRTKPTKKPTVDTVSYQPEPVLDEKEYQHILEIIKSMSLVIERNPASFASLDEESIRDHFLLQLNGHYEGGATGETFNASGKTDILIREENKNVFIAECKFWRGQKVFNEAVSQLLGYLTWRDSKCALMIFNRTKDSNAVRQKMHEAMESLPEHRKTVFHHADADSRYILVKESEPGKEIVVTTQLYDIPSVK
ncbi:hypothetical protein Dpo_35c00020 [Desulfotignum phosphitoxidans DSM 13687]|uniref:Uncharacterized protein n=1 Tax=Desulfotignum phosphitoxidans DSM 13687 TaxID=1286635 RepID=S0FPX9_9BACT|nr:hypothetical protein Dpo_35c00020 [Desulfotignum phosphitoxidans DSM 13687]